MRRFLSLAIFGLSGCTTVPLIQANLDDKTSIYVVCEKEPMQRESENVFKGIKCNGRHLLEFTHNF